MSAQRPAVRFPVPLPAPVLWLALAAGGLLLGCAAGSGSAKNKKENKEPIPIRAWSPEMIKIESSTGALLLDIDNSLKAWNKLYLTARDEADASTAKALEQDLAYKATKHQDVLIEQLESGGPTNRHVAALALGFTRGSQPRAGESAAKDPLSTLLGALEDPKPLVAANAAFAIGLLRRADTPTRGLLQMLQFSPEPKARTNAAWALKEVLDSGADEEGILQPARAALSDPEPGVRATCALILAALLDSDSIDDLSLQLYDDENHPAVAAARALAYIGSRVDTAKGACARALTGSLPRSRREVRQRVLAVLQQLASANYGPDNDEAWIDWAQRIP